MLWDLFLIAVDSIVTRKLRTWLTLIGIFVGIAAVFALVSVSEGLEMTVEDTLKSIGTNRVTIVPGGRFFGPASAALSVAQIDEDDLKVILKAKGVDYAVGMRLEQQAIKYKKETKFDSITGTQVDDKALRFYEEIDFFDVAEGRFLRQVDGSKVVVGHTIAYDKFEKDLTVGSKIEIGGESFEIVGILEKSGSFIGDAVIRMPMDAFRRLVGDKEKTFSMIIAKTREKFVPGEVAEDIKKDLRKHRRVEEHEEDFSVQTSEQAIGSLFDILNVIQVVLVGIASIALVVGGIGITNTMYTAVVERTRWIGLLKAIGAGRGHVVTIFLFEAGLLGFGGGVIGVAMGVTISKIIEYMAIYSGIDSFQSYFGWPLFAGTLLFSFVVGSLAGVLPANEASKLNLIEALNKR